MGQSARQTEGDAGELGTSQPRRPRGPGQDRTRRDRGVCARELPRYTAPRPQRISPMRCFAGQAVLAAILPP